MFIIRYSIAFEFQSNFCYRAATYLKKKEKSLWLNVSADSKSLSHWVTGYLILLFHHFFGFKFLVNEVLDNLQWLIGTKGSFRIATDKNKERDMV